MLLEQLARKKYAAIKRPRASKRVAPGSRDLAAHVKRAVWRRDDGRCRFIGTEGRCQERGFLEFRHLDAYALGGEGTEEKVELRCRAHNGYEADLYYGPGTTKAATYDQLPPEGVAAGSRTAMVPASTSPLTAEP